MKHVIMGIMMASAICILSFGQDENQSVLNLELGRPGANTGSMKIEAGRIYSTETGEPVSFEQMIQDLENCSMVYVGETHNSMPMHQIQADIIKALYLKDRNLSIGMEMFNQTQQTVLNQWSLGILEEEDFLRQSRWYLNWNFNFKFYSDILEEAKFNRIPVYGLNIPRNIISKIRMQGWDSLSDEERHGVPQPDLSHEGHRLLIRAIFENMEMPQGMAGAGLDMVFEGLYRAQAAWDEVMASWAVKGVQADGRRMVVLAGSGHLLYNLGINRRVYQQAGGAYKTVIAAIVPDDQGHLEISRGAADYVYALPEEEVPAFPSFGLVFKHFDGLSNPVIEREPIAGVAKGAGFEKGDVLLAINGRRFFDLNSLWMYLAKFQWNDKIDFKLLRGGEEKVIQLTVQMIEEDVEDSDKQE